MLVLSLQQWLEYPVKYIFLSMPGLFSAYSLKYLSTFFYKQRSYREVFNISIVSRLLIKISLHKSIFGSHKLHNPKGYYSKTTVSQVKYIFNAFLGLPPKNGSEVLTDSKVQSPWEQIGIATPKCRDYTLWQQQSGSTLSETLEKKSETIKGSQYDFMLWKFPSRCHHKSSLKEIICHRNPEFP